MISIRPALALLLVAAVSAHARAQDEPPPPRAPEGADDAKPGERKVAPEALERLTRWGTAMHLPAHTRAQRIAAKAAAVNQSMFQGGTVSVTTTWDRETGLSLDVTLPEEMTAGMHPQAAELARGMLQTWAREALAPVFEAPAQYARHYHVGDRTKGEETAVELLPCSADAAAERQVLTFDDQGLCVRRVMVPRVDPNDPSQQMMVGVEIETTFEYEKVGERSVLKRMSMLLPFGEMLVDYDYYEVTDGPPLLKTVTMATPFAPDPIEVTLSDYTLDGTAVAATRKAEEKAPPAEGDGETPEKESEAGDE